MKHPYRFITARAVSEDRLWIAALPDRDDLPDDTLRARLFEYDATRATPWESRDLPFAVIALTDLVEKSPTGQTTTWLGALSEDGEIYLRAGDQARIEGIAEAGLHRRGAAKLGYLHAAKQIGQHLYACGARGQVYRRTAPGLWEHADAGMFQAQKTLHRLVLHAIEGTSERDIHVAGDVLQGGFKGRLHHFDGAVWGEIALPNTKGVNAIYLEEDGRIWLAGSEGGLLCGNAKAGFEPLLPEPGAHLFHDVTRYRGTLYLASNQGLFHYDEEKRRTVKVRTRLAKEVEYASYVDTAGGVLWCVGPSDVVRFDGAKWSRLTPPTDAAPTHGVVERPDAG